MVSWVLVHGAGKWPAQTSSGAPPRAASLILGMAEMGKLLKTARNRHGPSLRVREGAFGGAK